MRKCTRKGLTAQAVEEAMEEHDGLVHAFIRRQGGGKLSYELTIIVCNPFAASVKQTDEHSSQKIGFLSRRTNDVPNN